MQIKTTPPDSSDVKQTLLSGISNPRQCADSPNASDRQPVTSAVPLQQQVIEIITHSLGGAGSKRVGPSASLKRDLRADALDKVEIILALEDSFDINISDLDAERIDTVRDAVDCVYHALNRSRR